MRKKILALVLCASCIGGVSVAIYNTGVKADEVKVLDYRAAEDVNQQGYQINKVDNEEAVAWINENEVLTMTSRAEDEGELKSFGSISKFNRYCSIYNLNTKESRDFKDVNIDHFYRVSKSGKYVLYDESRDITNKKGSEEYDAYYAGTIQRVPMKILNLETGEITDLKTQNKNADADYRWISDDKILTICNNDSDMWQILNINGEVCAEGKIDFIDPNDSGAFLSGVEELKDLGDTVEGKFYYTKWFRRDDNSLYDKVFSMDVSTKKEELIEGTDGDEAEKKGNSILMGHYENNGEAVDGVYENRTFGFRVFDGNGNIVQTQESPKGTFCGHYTLSSDGSKVCFLESPGDLASGQIDNNNSHYVIKIMDVKSGVVKEIAKLSDFEENDLGENVRLSVGSLKWDESGTSLMFSIEYAVMKKQTITLTEGDKKMFGTDEDTKEISVKEVLKNNTYIITFDK